MLVGLVPFDFKTKYIKVLQCHRLSSETDVGEGALVADGLECIVSISTACDEHIAEAMAASFHSRSKWDL